MKIKQFFLLNPKKLFLIPVVFLASVILHNLIYALTGIEEAFFFLIAVFGVPLYLLVAFLTTTIYFIRKKK